MQMIRKTGLFKNKVHCDITVYLQGEHNSILLLHTKRANPLDNLSTCLREKRRSPKNVCEVFKKKTQSKAGIKDTPDAN